MEVWARLFGYEENIYSTLAIILLMMARLVSILVLAPFLGGRLVPAQVKVATAIALSLVLFPLVKGSVTQPLPDLGPMFSVLILKEVFIGITIGFVSSLIFQALEVAGQLLDTARGSSLANVLVPQLEEQAPIFSQLKVQLGIVIFLLFNGHHYFLKGVFGSFQLLPIDLFPSLGSGLQFPEFIVRATAGLLAVGMQLVVPALIAIFMVDVILGIANRAAPQLNVFFLGMPIKGYLGILFALLALNYFVTLLGKQFQLMLRDVETVIYMMKPGS